MFRSLKHSSESPVFIHCVVLKIELFFLILIPSSKASCLVEASHLVEYIQNNSCVLNHASVSDYSCDWSLITYLSSLNSLMTQTFRHLQESVVMARCTYEQTDTQTDRHCSCFTCLCGICSSSPQLLNYLLAKLVWKYDYKSRKGAKLGRKTLIFNKIDFFT